MIIRVGAGLAGEIGRAYYWRENDNRSESISIDELLRRMHIPVIPEIKDRARRWLAGLPVESTFAMLDLLYIEQRLGCWAGPVHYAELPFRIYPFCHRRILELMLSLPADYKRRQMLSIDLIESQWPELLRLPFNQPMGIKRHVARAKRIAKRLGKNLLGK